MANLSPFRGLRERAQFLTAYDSIMRSWPIPVEEQDVATTFGETHIFVSGLPSAPPLVLLHGASATSAMWSPIIAVLSGTYRCYCIDTITDANKSVATQPIRGITDHVDWLQQIFSKLGIAKARVAGLSYGGWLAALLALHAPERVSHLVLLTPAATLAPLTTQFFCQDADAELAALTIPGAPLRPVAVRHAQCRARPGRGANRAELNELPAVSPGDDAADRAHRR